MSLKTWIGGILRRCSRDGIIWAMLQAKDETKDILVAIFEVE